MIIKSTKHSVIAGALQSLTGIVSVQDIIDAILQISNFKETTLKNIPKPGVVKNGTSLHLIFVDMDYQRRIAMLKLTNKIKKLENELAFKKESGQPYAFELDELN